MHIERNWACFFVSIVRIFREPVSWMEYLDEPLHHLTHTKTIYYTHPPKQPLCPFRDWATNATSKEVEVDHQIALQRRDELSVKENRKHGPLSWSVYFQRTGLKIDDGSNTTSTNNLYSPPHNLLIIYISTYSSKRQRLSQLTLFRKLAVNNAAYYSGSSLSFSNASTVVDAFKRC